MNSPSSNPNPDASESFGADAPVRAAPGVEDDPGPRLDEEIGRVSSGMPSMSASLHRASASSRSSSESYSSESLRTSSSTGEDGPRAWPLTPPPASEGDTSASFDNSSDRSEDSFAALRLA